MVAKRKAGILLHPTSLPGDFGIGKIGKKAREFVDFLAASRLSLWQVLPLGPTGYGDSPYQSVSSFAGNPYLIDLEDLKSGGLLGEEELESAKIPNTGKADFGALFLSSYKYLDIAWKRFSTLHGKEPPRFGAARGKSGSGSGAGDPGYSWEKFLNFLSKNADWLEDYCLFSSIKESVGHLPWDRWPRALKFRESSALKAFADEYGERIQRQAFIQYLFFSQWNDLRAYAHENGVEIIGDIPIFTAYDSADVWAHPELFQLDENLQPRKVAGVPPDYFTKTGQLWGNPVYDWGANAREGYAWWQRRVRAALGMVDIVRVDHFRGFSANWSVAAGEPTAEFGHWEAGPGEEFFRLMTKRLGPLPIIAEDLGVITQDVLSLREAFGFPGMKILQFAFENEAESGDYPHTYGRNAVSYTGTHDNDTCAGWFASASPAARRRALAYIHGKKKSFAWDMVRQVWASSADLAIAPLQDFLGLGAEARMNFPGKTSGWWTWRTREDWKAAGLTEKIRDLTQTYFRAP